MAALFADGYQCPVCLGVIEQAGNTPCGHVACFGCLTQAVTQRRSCPLCRKTIAHPGLVARLIAPNRAPVNKDGPENDQQQQQQQPQVDQQNHAQPPLQQEDVEMYNGELEPVSPAASGLSQNDENMDDDNDDIQLALLFAAGAGVAFL